MERERRARYRKQLPIVRSRGLRFLIAMDFGEWLFEFISSQAAAICTEDLEGIHDHYPVRRDFFPAKSWGKYRSVKIGFRVCYPATPKASRGVR